MSYNQEYNITNVQYFLLRGVVGKFGRDLNFINGNLFSSESMSHTSIAHSGQ